MLTKGPHSASLPNNRDQESTLWHLLLRTISLLVVLGVEMRWGHALREREGQLPAWAQL